MRRNQPFLLEEFQKGSKGCEERYADHWGNLALCRRFP